MPTAPTDPTGVDLPEKNRYTYADFQQLPEGAPYELIRGHLVRAPSPSVQHQRVVMRLGFELRAYLQFEEEGEVLLAPMDVHLSDEDVVHPDVLFVSQERADRIGTQKVTGAPDLVMEVVSPSTSHRDVLDKKHLYEQHGVREYWIVDPNTETVEIYVLDEGSYALHQRRVETDTASSILLDDFSIDLPQLFQ